MTTENLAKATELHRKIDLSKSSIKEIVDVLKDLELSNYIGKIAHFKLERTEVHLNKERTIAFLRNELKLEEQNLTNLDNEFYSL